MKIHCICCGKTFEETFLVYEDDQEYCPHCGEANCFQEINENKEEHQ